MAKFCQTCGYLADDDAKVCPSCGAAFPNDDTAEPKTVNSGIGEGYGAPAPAPAPAPTPISVTPNPYTTVNNSQSYQAPAYQAPVTGVPSSYGMPPYSAPVPPKKNKKPLIIGISVAAAVVVIAVVLLIIFLPKSGSSSGGSTNSASETSALAGSYTMTSQYDHGNTWSQSTLETLFGGTITLTVDSNNNGALKVSSENISMTFDPSSHTVTMQGGTSGTYALSGNQLTITFENGEVIDYFTKN